MWVLGTKPECLAEAISAFLTGKPSLPSYIRSLHNDCTIHQTKRPMDSKANYQKVKRQITESKTFANHLITIICKLNAKKTQVIQFKK